MPLPGILCTAHKVCGKPWENFLWLASECECAEGLLTKRSEGHRNSMFRLSPPRPPSPLFSVWTVTSPPALTAPSALVFLVISSPRLMLASRHGIPLLTTFRLAPTYLLLWSIATLVASPALPCLNQSQGDQLREADQPWVPLPDLLPLHVNSRCPSSSTGTEYAALVLRGPESPGNSPVNLKMNRNQSVEDCWLSEVNSRIDLTLHFGIVPSAHQ
ncbi:hypothetical protein CB1_000340075 [Camelus ferus]|nr:hypothetical protein CB1_000340075 [Camelus ferus]